MTLHHLFRSAELTTFINKLSHSESYSYSLEIETALAVALQQSSSMLSTQFINNPNMPYVIHSDFDNFCQLVNELMGAGSIHTAHGVMIQDVDGLPNACGGTIPDIPSTPKSGKHSLQVDKAGNLPECTVTRCQSPSNRISRWEYPSSEEKNRKKTKQFNLSWVFI